MSSLRPNSTCDTTPLQRFESQSSNGEEPSSPTSIIAAAVVAAATSTITTTRANATNANATGANHMHHNNNNNNVKVDLQLPPFANNGGLRIGAVVMANKPRVRGTAHIFRRILLDLAMLSCVGLPMLGFSLWGEPYKRGFFCSDVSLKHPYKDSTIRSWMLYLVCAGLPISTIVLVEFYRAQDRKPPRYAHYQQGSQGSGYYLCHLELPIWLIECYRKVGIFVFGLGVEQLTTEIAKYVIGRLRPHFFALCQPMLHDNSNCSDPINAQRYIEDFSCTGPDASAKLVKEVRLSFPSGHSSFTCYAMLYLVIYLQRRMHWKRIKMLRHMLQTLLLMFAWYTALTRVSDYKHHWSDVLAGAGIGMAYAIVVTCTLW